MDLKTGKYDHAAKKLKTAAKKMLSRNMYSFSIEYYTCASDLYIKDKKYLKAINIEKTVYQIHKLNDNIIELASSLE